MEHLVALFFGVVQGVTEFLPISGGGHLALIQNVNQTIFGEELFAPTLTFDILLRFGTLMAIVFVFFSDIKSLWNAFLGSVKDIRNKQFSLKSDDPDRRLLYMLILTALFLIPAVFLTEYLGNNWSGLMVISCMLLVSGVSNILIDKIGVKKHTNAFFEQNFSTEGLVSEVEPVLSENDSVLEEEPTECEQEESVPMAEVTLSDIEPSGEGCVSVADESETEDIPIDEIEASIEESNLDNLSESNEEAVIEESNPKHFLKQAGMVGLFQLCSSIPGISRCSLTVLGGLFAGFGRDFAVKYAFLSAIPVLVAKILLQMVTVLQDGIRMNWIPYLLGMIAAFLSGVFAIGLMRKSVRKYYCRRFGIYCIVLGIIIFVIQLRG